MILSLFLKAAEVKVLSFNIDTNIMRTEEGYARESHPKWRAGARSESIKNSLGVIIQKDFPDIIQIQECRHFKTKFGDVVDSLTPIQKFLESQGYETYVKPYNEGGGDRSFKYITAFNPLRFQCVQQNSLYFTKTPNHFTDRPSLEEKTEEEKKAIVSKIKEHNYGEEWERSTLILHLKDIHNGVSYYSFNVHLGITLDHRKEACKLLCDFVQNALQETPDAKIIMTGDFNTFPEWGGSEQLAIMSTALFDATDKLMTPDGQSIRSSFFAFPYDFAADEKRLNLTEVISKMPPEERRVKIKEVFHKECKALGGLLDHVFYRGFSEAHCTLVPTPLFETPTGYTEAEVKKYILDHYDQGPAFASDHQPLLTVFKS